MTTISGGEWIKPRARVYNIIKAPNQGAGSVNSVIHYP